MLSLYLVLDSVGYRVGAPVQIVDHPTVHGNTLPQDRVLDSYPERNGRVSEVTLLVLVT